MIPQKASYYIPILSALNEDLDEDFIRSVYRYVWAEENSDFQNALYANFREYSDQENPKLLQKYRKVMSGDIPDPEKLESALSRMFVNACEQIIRFESYNKQQIDEIGKNIESHRLISRDTRGKKFDEYAAFSNPLAAADYNYWLSQPAWDAIDCAVLSIGCDPRKISERDFEGRGSYASEIVARFKLVQSAAELAIQIGDLPNLIRPEDFMEYAQRKNLPLNKNLIAAFDQYRLSSSRVTSNDADVKLHGRKEGKYLTYLYVLYANLLSSKEIQNNKQSVRQLIDLADGFPEFTLSESDIRNKIDDLNRFREKELEKYHDKSIRADDK